MNINKIMRFGSSVFAIVLFVLAALKYFSGRNGSGVYYFIGAVGFLIVYLSYRKKEKRS